MQSDETNNNNYEKVKSCPVAALIESHGYNVETYEDVQTEDGYLITLHRIVNEKSQCKCAKPVALLVHGLMTGPADFLLTGPERALGFLLSDRGYDVWLLSARGGRASRKHIKYNPDHDKEYWEFSFHEMGMHDLPAAFHQIEKVTGQKTLTFIGHSLGTNLAFVLLSERPEYVKRVNLLIALSPQAIIPDVSMIYNLMSVTKRFWMPVLKTNKTMEFLPNKIGSFVSFMINRFIWQPVLVQMMNLLNGRSSQSFSKEDLAALVSYFPNTTSFYVLNHLEQLHTSGSFIKYDYGPEQNLQIYGTREPPFYDLSQIDCPTAMFCSSADLNGQPKNVRVLHDLLPNCVGLHELENPTFNHSDYLFGKEALKELYIHIFDYMEKYSRN